VRAQPSQQPLPLVRIPRPVRFNPPIRTTFEFEGAFGSYTVTRGMLRKMWIWGSGSTNAYPIFDAIRLDRVRVYSAISGSSPANGYTDLQLEWLGTYTNSAVFSARGTAVSPACLVTRPPPRSLAANWGNSTNDADQLFKFMSDDGFVLQLDVTYITANAANTVLAGTGATANMPNYNLLLLGVTPTPVTTVATVYV
jgi:hypothetical protein